MPGAFKTTDKVCSSTSESHGVQASTRADGSVLVGYFSKFPSDKNFLVASSFRLYFSKIVAVPLMKFRYRLEASYCINNNNYMAGLEESKRNIERRSIATVSQLRLI